MERQVSKEHYYNKYDTLKRFISYHKQIELIKNTGNNKVLEIGKGNGFLCDYLKKNNFDISTCDIDKDLNPDILSPITNIKSKDNNFDVVCAFEVLEHIPFKDFEIAIKELRRVSSDYVIVSIPYPKIPFEFIYQLPLFKGWFRLGIPLFWKRFKPSEEHFWEIGWKGYSLKIIRNILKKEFKIESECECMYNTYHHFFVLRV